MIVIDSTQDVPVSQLKSVFSGEPWDGLVTVDERQMCFKSMEPPSWLHLIAHLNWWQAAVSGAGTAILSGVLHEMGQEAWKNRAAVYNALRATPNILWALAERIVTLQQILPSTTRIWIGFPMGDGFHAGLCALDGTSAEAIGCQLARFSLAAGVIREFLESGDIKPAISVIVEFSNSDHAVLRWQDATTLQPQEFHLPI